MTEDENLHRQIINWGCSYLTSKGYTLKSDVPECVQNTPWSLVLRFLTSHGLIYLKHTPKKLALEASIIEILQQQFKAPVPEVIGNNIALGSFLMKDAGKPLRETLKRDFNPDLLCQAIKQFTIMQLSVADHLKTFLDLGVPDWRLEKLPSLYEELLLQKNILMADGLSELEIIELKNLQQKVVNLCNKLSAYSIKQTIVQPDFHDNNILLSPDSHKLTFIDLGEISISHPFFSLLNCLEQIKKHHSIEEEDKVYQRIKEVSLVNFIAVESEPRLIEAFAIASHLSLIYAALCNYRLITACDRTKFINDFQRHGRISVPLRKFMIFKR